MYKVRLNQFEGPLDLLLFFIKRDELNIYDIPIARLTKEFLDYVNLIKILDLEVAGDFILMASTLMGVLSTELSLRAFNREIGLSLAGIFSVGRGTPPEGCGGS